LLLASNDPGFGAGSVEQVGGITLGKGASRDGLNMRDSVVGTYEIPFATQVAGNTYEFLALYLVVAGTAPSITLGAYISIIAEP
jgi:hypothetical protein